MLPSPHDPEMVAYLADNVPGTKLAAERGAVPLPPALPPAGPGAPPPVP
jgi:hypothetical protein